MTYNYRESLSYWIISTAHLLAQELNDALAPLGITYRQAEVLVLLAVEGELSQVDMARKIGIEAPTLAGIVARMEAAGWITRESCPGDRRKKLLRATSQVEPIWSQVLEGAKQVRARASAGLTADQVQQLMALLEQVQGNLTATAGADGQGQASEVAAPSPSS